jgi:dTDP-4-dehydrorhamnose reductase
MATVLVTGATGMLGCSLVPFLNGHGHAVVRHGFHGAADENANLCKLDETLALLEKHQPSFIINLIALTSVDTCEFRPNSAYLANVTTVGNLCHSIKVLNLDCHLIQISTDHVYDGLGPHKESDVNISNFYAFSKAAAEVVTGSVSSTVLRTNFFGRSLCAGRASFTDWIYQTLQIDVPQPVFDDILFSPLSMARLNEMIERVIEHAPQGVFNLGSNGGMSKADFAYQFADLMGLSNKNLFRTLSTRVGLKAYRPKDMRMDCSLFEQRMGLTLPNLIDEIKSMRSTYLEKA